MIRVLIYIYKMEDLRTVSIGFSDSCALASGVFVSCVVSPVQAVSAIAPVDRQKTTKKKDRILLERVCFFMCSTSYQNKYSDVIIMKKKKDVQSVRGSLCCFR